MITPTDAAVNLGYESFELTMVGVDFLTPMSYGQGN
jgi:hypothetical protein